MSQDAPSDRLRDRLLDAILPLAPDKGWTVATLMAAAEAEGVTPGELELACPNGVSDLLGALADRAAAAARARMGEPDIATMKIRQKVAAGVRGWLAFFDPIKPAIERASGSPNSVLSGPKGVWKAADAIWAGLGDGSTDFNWYTKRITLSAVLGSTFLCWLKATDQAEVDAFLDRRIDNIMQFEKFKKQTREGFAKAGDPMDIFGKRRKT